MSAILLGLHLPPFLGNLGATERKRSYLEVGPEKERVSASVFCVAAAVSRQIVLVLRNWVSQSSNGLSVAERGMALCGLRAGNGTAVPFFGPEHK